MKNFLVCYKNLSGSGDIYHVDKNFEFQHSGLLEKYRDRILMNKKEALSVLKRAKERYNEPRHLFFLQVE
jgi:hypothetical protein